MQSFASETLSAGGGTDERRRVFPEGFVWGAATAGHQIEGNNVNSDFWFLEDLKPTTFVERSGHACDSCHRYEKDIALLAGLGLSGYRFSIAWSRIEPSRDHVSQAELEWSPKPSAAHLGAIARRNEL